jgi:DNA-binding XRE family transcriptional regulator
MADLTIPRARPQPMEVYYAADGRVFVTASGKDGQAFSRLWGPSSNETRQAIFDLRTKMGWSRALLAAIMGISTDTLRRWEDGRRNPSAATRKLIWFLHTMFLAPAELANLENIVTWGHGTKELIVVGESQEQGLSSG